MKENAFSGPLSESLVEALTDAIGDGIIHHRIVLQEESCLIRHCGDAFRNYMKKVRRYL